MATQPDLQKLKELFAKFDADGSGYITTDELGDVLNNAGKPATEDELKKMLTELDTDSDGSISFAEFVELFSKASASSSTLAPLYSVGTSMLSAMLLAPVNAVYSVGGTVAAVAAYPFKEKEFKDMDSSDIRRAIQKAKQEAARRRIAKAKAAVIAMGRLQEAGAGMRT